MDRIEPESNKELELSVILEKVLLDFDGDLYEREFVTKDLQDFFDDTSLETIEYLRSTTERKYFLDELTKEERDTAIPFLTNIIRERRLNHGFR